MLFGEITEVGLNLVGCRVRLSSGEVVPAHIPRHIARAMFRVVPGDRVAVQRRGTGRCVVVGHERVVIDAYAVAHLTLDGRAVGDWFFIEDCPSFWTRHGDIGNWLTSDNRLYRAVCDYLRRYGVPVY